MTERRADGGDAEPASQTAEAVYRQAVRYLEENSDTATASLDANLLMEHATGMTTLARISDPKREISFARNAALQAALKRRANGEPVHRIIGQREFYGLPLRITEHTLVPRPDTEILVDLILPHAKACVSKNGGCKVLDLGTGTGAIALAILSEVKNATATGVDLSPEALECAAKNAENLGLADRFTPLQSNWFSAVDGSFDIIVSNPPYIASKIIESLDRDVRDFDPRLALDGGEDGLDPYRLIAAQSGDYLSENGVIGVEIGYDQLQSVSAIFEAFGYHRSGYARDLGGCDRALIFEN